MSKEPVNEPRCEVEKEYIEMCEKREKTIQLEGYEYKQCEHGYCYQHSPEYKSSGWKTEERPVTKRDLWIYFWRNFYGYATNGGFFMPLYRTIKHYRNMRYHCGHKMILIAVVSTNNCKKCGRLMSFAENFRIISRCACCGYHS